MVVHRIERLPLTRGCVRDDRVQGRLERATGWRCDRNGRRTHVLAGELDSTRRPSWPPGWAWRRAGSRTR